MLLYGTVDLELKLYMPNGEERTYQVEGMPVRSRTMM
jgi:hypothetical protein